MPMKILNVRDDIPRGGADRQAAILGIATGLWMLNHTEGLSAPTLSPSPTATVPVMVFNGAKFASVSGSWDFAGAVASGQLQDVPPFRQMRYLLLLDKNGNPAIWPAIPSQLNEPQRWMPNPIESFCFALNSGTGYVCVGVLVVFNETELPWTPGTAFPAAPFTAEIIDGIDGDMIFAAPFSQVTVLAEPVLMSL